MAGDKPLGPTPGAPKGAVSQRRRWGRSFVHAVFDRVMRPQRATRNAGDASQELADTAFDRRQAAVAPMGPDGVPATSESDKSGKRAD